MIDQLRWGRMRFIVFLAADIVCLVLANMLAAFVYLSNFYINYGYSNHKKILGIMVIIDILVTVFFNTLKNVLRRTTQKEIAGSIRHVAISFVILALVLFSIKQGAAYSRVTVYLVYLIDLFLIIIAHFLLKYLFSNLKKKKSSPLTLLVTTSDYLQECLGIAGRAELIVKGVLLVDDNGIEENREHYPFAIVRHGEISAFLCWEWIEQVFICGKEDIGIYDELAGNCKELKIPIKRKEKSKSFEYEMISIRTVLQKDNSGLSFFEGEHDIPFKIKEFCTVYEKEKDALKGFQAKCQIWCFFFCPFGEINVYIDTGKTKKVVCLNDPSVGLILQSGIWHEITWKTPGSILCVASSGHYDPDNYNTDYKEYQNWLKEREWTTVIESADIMGE